MTDHLSRQPFIDMLKTIVQSQRGNPAGYSLAIDSEWGCGKTWVLDAIEEYANTGFSILDRRGKEKPGYIEDIELVVQDVLSDKAWAW